MAESQKEVRPMPRVTAIILLLASLSVPLGAALALV